MLPVAFTLFILALACLAFGALDPLARNNGLGLAYFIGAGTCGLAASLLFLAWTAQRISG